MLRRLIERAQQVTRRSAKPSGLAINLFFVGANIPRKAQQKKCDVVRRNISRMLYQNSPMTKYRHATGLANVFKFNALHLA